MVTRSPSSDSCSCSCSSTGGGECSCTECDSRSRIAYSPLNSEPEDTLRVPMNTVRKDFKTTVAVPCTCPSTGFAPKYPYAPQKINGLHAAVKTTTINERRLFGQLKQRAGAEVRNRLRAGIDAKPDFMRQEKTFIAHFEKKPIDQRLYEIERLVAHDKCSSALFEADYQRPKLVRRADREKAIWTPPSGDAPYYSVIHLPIQKREASVPMLPAVSHLRAMPQTPIRPKDVVSADSLIYDVATRQIKADGGSYDISSILEDEIIRIAESDESLFRCISAKSSPEDTDVICAGERTNVDNSTTGSTVTEVKNGAVVNERAAQREIGELLKNLELVMDMADRQATSLADGEENEYSEIVLTDVVISNQPQYSLSNISVRTANDEGLEKKPEAEDTTLADALKRLPLTAIQQLASLIKAGVCVCVSRTTHRFAVKSSSKTKSKLVGPVMPQI